MRVWRTRFDRLIASTSWSDDSRVRRLLKKRRYTARNCRPACGAIERVYKNGALVVRLDCELSFCINCWARVIARCYARFDRALYKDLRISLDDEVPIWHRPGGPYKAVPRVRLLDVPRVDPDEARSTPAFWLLDRRIEQIVETHGPARGRLREALQSRRDVESDAYSRFDAVGVHGGVERAVVTQVEESIPGRLTWNLEHRMLLLVAPGWDPEKLSRPVRAWMEDDPNGLARTEVVPIRHCGDLSRAVASWGELEPLAYSGSVDHLAVLLEARQGIDTHKSFGLLRKPPSKPLNSQQQEPEPMADDAKKVLKKLPPKPTLVVDKFMQKVKDIPTADRDSFLVDYLVDWLENSLAIPSTSEEAVESVKAKSIRLRQLFTEVMLEGEAESQLRDALDKQAARPKSPAAAKATPVAKPKLDPPAEPEAPFEENGKEPKKSVKAAKPEFESLAGRWVTYKSSGVAGLIVGRVTEDNGKKVTMVVTDENGVAEPWPGMDRNSLVVAEDASEAKARAKKALEEAQAIADEKAKQAKKKADAEAKAAAEAAKKAAEVEEEDDAVEEDDDAVVEEDDDDAVEEDDDSVVEEEEETPKPVNNKDKKPKVLDITLPTPPDVMARFKVIPGREKPAPKFKNFEARFEDGDTVAVAQYNLEVGEKVERRLIVYAINADTSDPNGVTVGRLELVVLKAGAKSTNEVDDLATHEPIIGGMPGPFRIKIGRTLCDLTFATGSGKPFYKADLFEDAT